MTKTSRGRGPGRRARRPGIEALEGRALLSGVAASRSPAARPAAEVREAARRGFGVARTASGVPYSRSGSKLDVYQPVGSPPPPGGFPAIIALPGGGWREVRREDYGAAVASAFGPSGYVVVPADYLYASDGGGRSWPGNVRDVRDAVRWVRKNAGSLGVDPRKIVVSGESAGGHLAALAGTLPEGAFAPDSRRSKLVDARPVSGKPDAVVVFYGPTDLVHEWRARGEARPYLVTFLGGPLDRVPGRYEAASPLGLVSPDDAPAFLIQGTADKIIPVSQTVAFDEALKDAGVAESLTLLPGVPHGFRFRIKTLDLAAEVRAFLDRVWAERDGAGSAA